MNKYIVTVMVETVDRGVPSADAEQTIDVSVLFSRAQLVNIAENGLQAAIKMLRAAEAGVKARSG